MFLNPMYLILLIRHQIVFFGCKMHPPSSSFNLKINGLLLEYCLPDNSVTLHINLRFVLLSSIEIWSGTPIRIAKIRHSTVLQNF